MDSVGGPDAKKARWSPTSFNGTTPSNGLTTHNSGTSASNRDAFANYGYGPQASISQSFQPNSSPAFTPNALYSTPSLSINTAVNGHGMQMGAQMSPHTAAGFAQQHHTGQQGQANGASPYSAGAFGYGMLGMGLPSVGMLGGFPYASQSGNFGQVCRLVWNIQGQHGLRSLSDIYFDDRIFLSNHVCLH
jgi:hypothetical protein